MTRKPKRTPTERARIALILMRTSLTFREIVDLIRRKGVTTSISHLHRIVHDNRDATLELAEAAEGAVKSWRASA